METALELMLVFCAFVSWAYPKSSSKDFKARTPPAEGKVSDKSVGFILNGHTDNAGIEGKCKRAHAAGANQVHGPQEPESLAHDVVQKYLSHTHSTPEGIGIWDRQVCSCETII